MNLSFFFIATFLIQVTSVKADVFFDKNTNEINISSKDGKNYKFLVNNYQSAFDAINEISDDEDKKKAIRIVLQHYPAPTPEEILIAGLEVKDQALNIIKMSSQSDCFSQKIEEDPAIGVAKEKKCYICSIAKNDDFSDYKLIVGSIFHPNEISVSIVGANDQPLHGSLESFFNVGDDVNGHTYGSKFNFEAVYDWGKFTMDAGTDLYVLSYDKDENKSAHYYTASYPRKVLQEADEHSYVHLGARINLSDSYLKFKMGYEVDSDQGIGRFGAISHRESWHKMGGTRGNEYVNHMSDRKEFIGAVKMGKEFNASLNGVGFCAEIEGGVSAGSSGRLSIGGEARAQVNSGNYFGGSRSRPLIAVNFSAGINNPIIEGKLPIIETDSRYDTYLTNRNYAMVEDLRSSYVSTGIEIGGKKLSFGVDAVFEKNAWNDGDILYVTTLKYKFK